MAEKVETKKSTRTLFSFLSAASRLFCIDSLTRRSNTGVLLFCRERNNALPVVVILAGSAFSICIL